MYPLRCPTVSRGSSGEQCRSDAYSDTIAGAVAGADKIAYSVAISTAIVESQCVANFGSDIGADVPADDCADRTSVTVANKSAVNKTNSTADAQSNWCSHRIANSTSYQ